MFAFQGVLYHFQSCLLKICPDQISPLMSPIPATPTWKDRDSFPPWLADETLQDAATSLLTERQALSDLCAYCPPSRRLLCLEGPSLLSSHRPSVTIFTWVLASGKPKERGFGAHVETQGRSSM